MISGTTRMTLTVIPRRQTMGKRGPPPMTQAQRKVRGRQHRKKEPATPTPDVGAPPMPEHVRKDPIARAAWKRFCKDLTAMEVLAPEYWALLEVFCSAYSAWRNADAI